MLSSIEGPFESLLNGTNGVSLASVIANVTGGQNPFRIVTTGYGAGTAYLHFRDWIQGLYQDLHLLSCNAFFCFDAHQMRDSSLRPELSKES